MVAFHSRLCVGLAITFLCILRTATGSAQELDVNGMPIKTEELSTGCPRLAVLPPLPSSTVVSCQKADSVEVSFPLKPDGNGYAREKKVRGAYDFREYRIGKMEMPAAFDNLLDALPMAGFTVKYSIKPSTITARKDDTWILINVSDDLYNVSVIRTPPGVLTSVKTAEEISREMQAHNRVDIYGIEFSPTDQSILEEKSQILLEILKYLKQDPGISIIIESDKVSPGGAPEDDLEVTRERANAIMDWLIAHGITRSHIQPRPAGRKNPLTEDESSSENQRNEKIVLIKSQM